jgi:hypothetical protein
MDLDLDVNIVNCVGVVLPPTEGVITPSLLLKTTKKQYNIIISNYLYVFLKRKTHIEIQKKHIEIYLSFFIFNLCCCKSLDI